MRIYFAMTSYDIQQKYQIVAFPTVLMFVNGNVVAKWEMVYDMNQYRKDINAAPMQKLLPSAFGQ